MHRERLEFGVHNEVATEDRSEIGPFGGEFAGVDTWSPQACVDTSFVQHVSAAGDAVAIFWGLVALSLRFHLCHWSGRRRQ